MVESPTLSVRVPPEVAEWLRAEAARQRRSTSQLVALILDDYVRAQQAGQAAEPGKKGSAKKR